MQKNIFKNQFRLAYRIISVMMAAVFGVNVIVPPNSSYAQSLINPPQIFGLPAPGTMVPTSPGFEPVLIKGLSIHPEHPLEFDFIIDTGDTQLKDDALRQESGKLIKYFLAALTVPEQELWVNLSPYEKDRVIPRKFGETALGRDLLAQDYILKQLSASLIYPEEALGQDFWQKIYQKSMEVYGTTDIPVDTFHKVWIVPREAVVYEHWPNAFVIQSRLKVMLEEDYLAIKENEGVSGERLAFKENEGVSQILRDLIIPQIEKEVNEGENFASLRQIYHAVILAKWFKKNLKESLLGKVYVDQNKINGIDLEDKQVKEKIYQQYIEAFRKGVFDFIKEEYDPQAQEVIPRKYFSGGSSLVIEDLAVLTDKTVDQAMLDQFLDGATQNRKFVVSAELYENPAAGDAVRKVGNGAVANTAGLFSDGEQTRGDLAMVELDENGRSLREIMKGKIFSELVTDGKMTIISKEGWEDRKIYTVNGYKLQGLGRNLKPIVLNENTVLLEFKENPNFVVLVPHKDMLDSNHQTLFLTDGKQWKRAEWAEIGYKHTSANREGAIINTPYMLVDLDGQKVNPEEYINLMENTKEEKRVFFNQNNGYAVVMMREGQLVEELFIDRKKVQEAFAKFEPDQMNKAGFKKIEGNKFKIQLQDVRITVTDLHGNRIYMDPRMGTDKAIDLTDQRAYFQSTDKPHIIVLVANRETIGPKAFPDHFDPKHLQGELFFNEGMAKKLRSDLFSGSGIIRYVIVDLEGERVFPDKVRSIRKQQNIPSKDFPLAFSPEGYIVVGIKNGKVIKREDIVDRESFRKKMEAQAMGAVRPSNSGFGSSTDFYKKSQQLSKTEILRIEAANEAALKDRKNDKAMTASLAEADRRVIRDTFAAKNLAGILEGFISIERDNEKAKWNFFNSLGAETIITDIYGNPIEKSKLGYRMNLSNIDLKRNFALFKSRTKTNLYVIVANGETIGPDSIKNIWFQGATIEQQGLPAFGTNNPLTALSQTHYPVVDLNGNRQLPENLIRDHRDEIAAGKIHMAFHEERFIVVWLREGNIVETPKENVKVYAPASKIVKSSPRIQKPQIGKILSKKAIIGKPVMEKLAFIEGMRQDKPVLNQGQKLIIVYKGKGAPVEITFAGFQVDVRQTNGIPAVILAEGEMEQPAQPISMARIRGFIIPKGGSDLAMAVDEIGEKVRNLMVKNIYSSLYQAGSRVLEEESFQKLNAKKVNKVFNINGLPLDINALTAKRLSSSGVIFLQIPKKTLNIPEAENINVFVMIHNKDFIGKTAIKKKWFSEGTYNGPKEQLKENPTVSEQILNQGVSGYRIVDLTGEAVFPDQIQKMYQDAAEPKSQVHIAFDEENKLAIISMRGDQFVDEPLILKKDSVVHESNEVFLQQSARALYVERMNNKRQKSTWRPAHLAEEDKTGEAIYQALDTRELKDLITDGLVTIVEIVNSGMAIERADVIYNLNGKKVDKKKREISVFLLQNNVKLLRWKGDKDRNVLIAVPNEAVIGPGLKSKITTIVDQQRMVSDVDNGPWKEHFTSRTKIEYISKTFYTIFDLDGNRLTAEELIALLDEDEFIRLFENSVDRYIIAAVRNKSKKDQLLHHNPGRVAENFMNKTMDEIMNRNEYDIIKIDDFRSFLRNEDDVRDLILGRNGYRISVTSRKGLEDIDLENKNIVIFQSKLQPRLFVVIQNKDALGTDAIKKEWFSEKRIEQTLSELVAYEREHLSHTPLPVVNANGELIQNPSQVPKLFRSYLHSAGGFVVVTSKNLMVKKDKIKEPSAPSVFIGRLLNPGTFFTEIKNGKFPENGLTIKVYFKDTTTYPEPKQFVLSEIVKDNKGHVIRIKGTPAIPGFWDGIKTSLIKDIEIVSLPSPTISDNAMSTSKDKLGGIDLTFDMLDLQIKRDGNGVPLPVIEQPLDKIEINGFIPVIINIAPVTNLQLLLGMNAPSQQDAPDAAQRRLGSYENRDRRYFQKI